MRKLFIFILSLLFLFPSSAQFRVIGYLPNWGSFVTNANNLDYSKITHLNIAFINPTDASGTLGPTTGLSTVVQKAHDNNVFILASMGGASSPSYYTTLLQDANRPAFINKIVDFVNAYNLDGIDVDLEGTAIDGNYEKFVTDLKDTLSQLNKLTTAAVATWFSSSITNGALAQFDFINIMSYDATGPWAPGNPGQHSPYSMAVSDLYHWGTTRGVAASKMSLGVPFYGYNFGASGYSSSLTFNDIITDFPGSENDDEVSINGGTIYYNGIPTIKSKTQLALSDAGGIMIWQLIQDATGANSLLTAIHDVVSSSGTNLPPTVSITSPANHSAFTDADTIQITTDATDSDGSIYKVSFYAGTLFIGEDFTTPYSIDWAGAGTGTYYITARALDNYFLTTTSDKDTITVTNSPVQLPFGGIAWEIPGRIEAENFDVGGSTFAYSDNNAINEGGYYRTTSVDIEPCTDAGGGYNVGWTVPAEWLEYSVEVTSSDLYDLNVRVATTLNSKKFHIELDGVNVTGNINIPNTGGWQTWQTVTVSNMNLTAGNYIAKVVFDQGDFNLNYVEFTPSSLTSVVHSTASVNQINCFPNPSLEKTTLEFDLKESGNTRIGIYDLNGREIMPVYNGYLTKGNQSQIISLKDLEKGIYICSITTEEGSTHIKLAKE